ncbi:hypothetical protein N8000_07400 [Rhodospirillales bacterium]|nr:hypothetical protein [Rhodospirillales bacterium]
MSSKEKLIQLLSSGVLLTPKEAAQQIGCTYSYVMDISYQYGLPLKKRSYSDNPIDRIELQFAEYKNKISNYRTLTVEEWFAEAKTLQD